MSNESKNTSPDLKASDFEPADFSEIMDGDSTRQSKGSWKIVLGLIAAVILIAYGAGVYYYNNHFLHNTYVNNTRLGEMTVDEAEKTFTEDFSSHKIAVKEKERTEIIDPQDVKAVIAVGDQIKELKASQNPWLWFTGLFGKEARTIHLDVTYDEQALKDTISSMECFQKENIRAPKDAYIKVGDKEFEIVPEVLGNTVKKKKLIERIGEAFSTCETKIDLESENLYKLPGIYSTDENITKALSKANKYSHGTITYDFSYTTETLDYETLKNWVNISKKFKVTLNSDKIESYVAELCSKYNTMGSSRDFTTANGEKIHVYDGDYGWKIYTEKEIEQLKKDIKSGKDVNREPEYSYKAMCRNSARDDIGNSYVEISIAYQEVWLFIDGKCVLDTSCVTGMPVAGRRTYTGVYSITYKQRNGVLVGEGYASKVKYWMPFDNNRGLHDASWRNSFGGSIYKSDGSHGCVNLPTYAAETLFKYVDAGFPVVIY